MLGPAPDNLKGYWEHAEILAFNEQVMAALDRPWWSGHPIALETWESRDLDELKARAASLLIELFGGQRLWGFKDPKTIRLFPFWRDVLGRLEPSVSIVLAIRSPQSAVNSLVKRENMPIDDAEELWLAYMLPWLPDIATHSVMVVDYDRLIRSPLRELRRVANHLGVTIDPEDSEITEYTRGFVERDLRHHLHPAGRRTDDGQRPTLADETYAALLRLTRPGASWRGCLELSRRYQIKAFGQKPSLPPGPSGSLAPFSCQPTKAEDRRRSHRPGSIYDIAGSG